MSEDSDAFAPEFIVPSENRLLQTVDEAKWREHTQKEEQRRREQAKREAAAKAKAEAEARAEAEALAKASAEAEALVKARAKAQAKNDGKRQNELEDEPKGQRTLSIAQAEAEYKARAEAEAKAQDKGGGGGKSGGEEEGQEEKDRWYIAKSDQDKHVQAELRKIMQLDETARQKYEVVFRSRNREMLPDPEKPSEKPKAGTEIPTFYLHSRKPTGAPTYYVASWFQIFYFDVKQNKILLQDANAPKESARTDVYPFGVQACSPNKSAGKEKGNVGNLYADEKQALLYTPLSSITTLKLKGQKRRKVV